MGPDKKIGLIGIFGMLTGILIELYLLTVGLYVILYSYSMNKNLLEVLYYLIGLLYGASFFVAGYGIRHRRPTARVIFIISCSLMIFLIACFIFSQIKEAFSSMGFGSEFFDAGSWFGGMIFWLLVGALVLWVIVFLNSNKVKELFKNQRA